MHHFATTCDLGLEGAELPTAVPEDVGLCSRRLERIGEVLNRHISAGGITGAVTAFARRGHLVHLEAHGLSDLEAGVAMPQDAIFQMYSSSKVVTAVAVLIMMERGLLRLEDPISRYIPEFAGATVAVPRDDKGPPAVVDADRDLTIRDLMTHTGGLLSRYAGRAEIEPEPRGLTETLAEYVARLARVPLDYQPGVRWSYSPLAGCDVLARVLEIVCQRAFETVLAEEIFAPLGMDDTHFAVPEAKRHRLLPVYRREEGAWRRLADTESAASVSLAQGYISGSMGLVSTARDFLRFQQMLTGKGEVGGVRLLGARTVELMATNHVGDLYRGEGAYAAAMHGHGFGLLVQVVLDPVNGNTGRSKGAFGFGGHLGTMNWSDPAEEIAAIVMLQQNNREVHIDIERAIRQAIIN